MGQAPAPALSGADVEGVLVFGVWEVWFVWRNEVVVVAKERQVWVMVQCGVCGGHAMRVVQWVGLSLVVKARQVGHRGLGPCRVLVVPSGIRLEVGPDLVG